MAYAQKDPRWANVNLGNSGYSIGGYGCMLISFCNVAEQYGHKVNPLEMNQLLMSKGVQVDNLGGADLAKVYPDIQFRGFKAMPTSIDLTVLGIQAQQGVEGIVKLDYNPNQVGVQTHFCRLRGVDANGNVVIDDSLDGQRVLVKDRYGKQDWAIHGVDLFYKPTAVTPEPTPPPAPVPVDPCAAVKAENVALKAQVTKLNDQIANLNNQIKVLESEKKVLQDKNIELGKVITNQAKEIESLKAQVGDSTKWSTLKSLLKELIS